MTALPPSESHVSDMDPARRQLLLGATAVGAATLGLGYAWWRVAPPAPVEPIPGFWGLQWTTPTGEALAAQTFRGKLLLLNFWATWCAPCVEELPLIDAFYRENMANGTQVVALAVDRPGPVQSFLQQRPLTFPVAMAGPTSSELLRSLGNISGGLPFSVLVGAGGAILQRKLGRLHPEDLALWRSLK